jgi:orotidine 5'-phosphate decarboxylase subfamily 2
VKPNIAFFECHGTPGYGAYERTCSLANASGLLVLGDIKRGDIGSTAEAYAEGHFRFADAVTLHPYLGLDSVQPFLSACHPDGAARRCSCSCAPATPAPSDFQDLRVGSETLCDVVARTVTRWAADLPPTDGYRIDRRRGRCDLAERPRAAARRYCPQLAPAAGRRRAGRQGRRPRAGVRPPRPRRLVDQSRGVHAVLSAVGHDWLDRIEAAAKTFAARMS